MEHVHDTRNNVVTDRMMALNKGQITVVSEQNKSIFVHFY